MHALSQRVRGSGKPVFVGALVLVAVVLMLATSEPFYPIREWLLWHYLAILGLALFAVAAMLSLGDWLLRVTFRLRLPTHERLALALALGSMGFEIGMFLIGTVGGYGVTTFVLYPLALVLLAFPELRNHLRRCRRVAQLGARLSVPQFAYVLFGCLALALIYFSILTPHNVQFDARWKHMALAEDYVAHGGLRRMPEGWVFAARPHLTSYLYAWAFLLPVGSLFHRMELCAHLEYVTFLSTTFFGISALVRRLVPSADPRVVWAARFLFPGVLLYDSSLSAGADHFGAILAPAIALSVMRVHRRYDRHWVLLLTTLLAGAVMVKETVAIMLVPLPACYLVLRAAWSILDARTRGASPRESLATLALAGVLGVTLTAPFWLKNWIWYGNPVYPSLSHLFPSAPWSDLAAYRFEVEYSETNMWSPDRDLGGILRSLFAALDFSFLPNDWSRFHGDRPVFGSLFTLLTPLLFFLRKTKRIWILVGWVYAALVTWYWVHHQDRYLQAILPLMAAATAAILALAFQQLRPTVRSLLVLLVGTQVALGADVYFIATHAMTGSAVKRVVELLSLGHQGKYEERFEVERRYTALAAAIPPKARVLFHDMQAHLGSEHEAIRDVALWQSGINYSLTKHPNEIHRLLKGMGASYIVVNPGKTTGSDRLSSDLLFLDFVYRRTERLADVEGLHVFRLPEIAREVPFRDRALVVKCGTPTPYEVHPISALARPGYGPLSKKITPALAATQDPSTARNMLEQVDFVAVTAKCDPPPGVTAQFVKAAERPKRGLLPPYSLYIRRAESNWRESP
ncbi:MAG: hypothetical protein QM784_08205 [Polyangiaceae bacterium]